jgi:hypothetical protein
MLQAARSGSQRAQQVKLQNKNRLKNQFLSSFTDSDKRLIFEPHLAQLAHYWLIREPIHKNPEFRGQARLARGSDPPTPKQAARLHPGRK